MKSISLTLMIAVFALAGCQSGAKFSCAGWKKPVKANEPARMVQVEPELTRWIIATDRFGQKQKCWK